MKNKNASDEKRKRLIEKTYLNGFKYAADGKITGFYLPDFGNGLIIAENNNPGLELMKFKYARDNGKIVVPESNRIAVEYLLSHGFKESLKVPRMFLGSETEWIPEMIFSRGSGYSG